MKTKLEIKNAIELILISIFFAMPVLGDGATAKLDPSPTPKEREERKASFVKLMPMMEQIAADSKFTPYLLLA